MRMVDRMMKAMDTGRPLDMALASWSYSRACGLTRWEAFVGAAQLFFDYLTRKTP